MCLKSCLFIFAQLIEMSAAIRLSTYFTVVSDNSEMVGNRYTHMIHMQHTVIIYDLILTSSF